MVAQATDSSSPITFTQAAKHCPGRPKHVTVWRWAREGIVARNGQRIRLGHVTRGRRMFTTLADIQRFFAELQAADLSYFDKRREPTQREHVAAERAKATAVDQANAAAAESLRGMGIAVGA